MVQLLDPRAFAMTSVGRELIAKPSRIRAIDGLRGLLAVVVLAWHVCSPFGVAWMLDLANVAVALFFVLSGYVLTRGWDGRYGVFLIRRFLRLWPVYALCLGAGYLIAGVHPVWSEFFWYPLIGPNDKPAIDPPVWSLFLEAWTMPLMPLIVWSTASTSHSRSMRTPISSRTVMTGLWKFTSPTA
jgi:peptidoglycan/LPS O-acetylase OafA/YrhL